MSKISSEFRMTSDTLRCRIDCPQCCVAYFINAIYVLYLLYVLNLRRLNTVYMASVNGSLRAKKNIRPRGTMWLKRHYHPAQSSKFWCSCSAVFHFLQTTTKMWKSLSEKIANCLGQHNFRTRHRIWLRAMY